MRWSARGGGTTIPASADVGGVGAPRTLTNARRSAPALSLTHRFIEGEGQWLTEILWEGHSVVASAPIGKSFSKVHQGFLYGCEPEEQQEEDDSAVSQRFTNICFDNRSPVR